MELQLGHFVTGLKKVSCEEEKHHLIDLFIQKQIYKPYLALLMSLMLLKKKEKFVMLEYHLDTKKMIYNDKLLSYKKSTLVMKLLVILAQELIGKEKDLKPFWNNQCLEMSQKLWLPIETDYVGLDMTSSSLSWKKTELNSHCVIKATSNPTNQNSQMILCQLSTSIQCDNLEEEDIIRTRKLKIYPNQNQKKILSKWFGTTRFLYNQVLYKHKNENEPISSFQTLRNKFVTAKDNDIPIWQLETPKDIRAETLRDLNKSYKVNLSNLKKKNISHFSFHYRKKKSNQSIVIPKSALKIKNNNLFIYSTYIKDKINCSKRDFEKNKNLILNKNNKVDFDCRITFNGLNYYLLIPYKVEKINNLENKKICSLDPGFRTFQTLYSNNEVKRYIYKKDKINKLIYKIDKLKSLRDKKEVKKIKANKKINITQNKLTNIITDTHNKIISDLVKNYDYILLPNFENQKIQSNSKNRKLNRKFNIYSHFTFKEKLKNKIRIYKNKKMYNPSEEYTSKTCTRCGLINSNLGASEVFNCNQCHLKINRDINGARNIFIKSFL